MPKIKKKPETDEDYAQQTVRRALLKKKMFTSAAVTFGLAVVCFVISFIFNGKLYIIANPDNSTLVKVIIVLIKGGSIVAAFFFLFISYANMMELRGYLMSFKHIVILVIMTVIQSISNTWVFLTCLVGIVGVIFYLYLIQARIRKRDVIQV
jgi:hypothetical protein